MVADPTNEPNFYAISVRYPLDESPSLVSKAEEATAVEPAAKRQRIEDATVVVPTTVSSTSGAQAMAPASEIQLLLAILEAKQKHEEEQRAALALAMYQEQQKHLVSLNFFGGSAI